MASLEELEERIRSVAIVAQEARDQSQRNAQDVATNRSLQREQSFALAKMADAQTELLVSVTEVNTNVQWVREELAKKVDDAAVAARVANRAAEDAKEQAKDAQAAKSKSSNAQLISVVAILASVIAALLGIDILPL